MVSMVTEKSQIIVVHIYVSFMLTECLKEDYVIKKNYL